MATTVFSGFTGGDYNSTHTGTNNFWLDTNSNTYTQDKVANTTTITTNFTLNHGGSGTEFSGGWNLRTYLKVSYVVNGVAATQYFYSDAVRSYTATMTNGVQYSLGSGTKTLPHNSDGTPPTPIVIEGYCSHWSSGTGAYPGVGGSAVTTPTYVPGPTLATVTITSIPSISKGERWTGTAWVSPSTSKRFIGIGNTTTNANGATVSADANGYVDITLRRRYDGTTWVEATN